MAAVLFLDIDGVLNDHKKHPNGYGGIRADLAYLLNEVLAAVPNLGIVVTSSWRYPFKWDADVAQFVLMQGGVDCWGRVLGCTCSDEAICPRSLQPHFNDRERWVREGLKWRAAQIMAWVAWHSPERYAVLDDLDLTVPHLFQTNGNVGLTMTEAQALIGYFQEASP